MVSRLSAEPGGHWEKSSQRAIFPNGLRIGDGGAFEKRQPNICTNTQ
jgi:hypothetical protein